MTGLRARRGAPRRRVPTAGPVGVARQASAPSGASVVVDPVARLAARRRSTDELEVGDQAPVWGPSPEVAERRRQRAAAAPEQQAEATPPETEPDPVTRLAARRTAATPGVEPTRVWGPSPEVAEQRRQRAAETPGPSLVEAESDPVTRLAARRANAAWETIDIAAAWGPSPDVAARRAERASTVEPAAEPQAPPAVAVSRLIERRGEV